MALENELPFRLIFFGIFSLTISISAYYRKQARASGETISRLDEGILALLLRAALALPLLASFMLYVFIPAWLSWSTLTLPIWVRWMGAGIGVLCIPFLGWVFRSIGGNISETILTKDEHQLVTDGPYRWVRHPLYAGALVELLCLGILASNWFMLLIWAMGAAAIRLVVIPKEEAQLIRAFGQEYEAYQERTGALLPRLWP